MATGAYGSTPRRRVMGPVIVTAVLATMAAPVLGALADTDLGRAPPATAPAIEPGGPAGTMHASVTHDGRARLGRNSGARAVRDLGRGVSQVRFARPVRQCGVSATVAAGSRPGLVSVAPSRATARALRVETFAPDGAPADRDYHLAVTCPDDQR
jgi:hypothetical protein